MHSTAANLPFRRSSPFKSSIVSHSKRNNDRQVLLTTVNLSTPLVSPIEPRSIKKGSSIRKVVSQWKVKGGVNDTRQTVYGKQSSYGATRAMNDIDLLRSILVANRNIALYEGERFKIEILRCWSDELAKPRNADPKRLLRYGFKIYSQNDEDGIIQEIFRRIGVSNRRFVEFGVQNGFECNTAKLLVDGWQGLWIEADGKAVAQIRKHFENFLTNGDLTLAESMVTVENINSTFQKAGVTGEIDILAIDIDGNDYWVWKALEVARPRVVMIEYNTSLRPPLSLVVPYHPTRTWGGTNYFGASLEALVRLGRTKGYRIVGCCFAGVNAFFVRDDLCGDLFLEPATAEEHYEPDRYFARFMPSGHAGRPGPYQTV